MPRSVKSKLLIWIVLNNALLLGVAALAYTLGETRGAAVFAAAAVVGTVGIVIRRREVLFS